MTEPRLDVKNLSVRYTTDRGTALALDNVNLALPASENLGLVGESGCGKSTFLKAVMGVLPDNADILSGAVVLEGEDMISASPERQRARRWKEMSMITQSALNSLDPVHRVGDQIIDAIRTHEKVSRKDAAKRVKELFELVGVDPKRFREFPHQFSGGMRQRAIIAMALVLNPSVVLADEPTTSLDVIVQDQIFRRIRELQNSFGFSILLVTHDLALVIENCERICKWMQYHYSLTTNPSDGIKKKPTPKSDGHIPWASEEIETYRTFWPIGTMERLAFELIFWTGARVSDAIRLGEGNVDREGWLAFTQQKTGGEVAIPFKRELPEFADCYALDLALLHNAISARNERHMTFLHTQKGASRSAKSISQWFAAKTRKAGIMGSTAHGLRKSRAIALAEAGAGSPQIGAWTGHETLKEIERYILKFNKRKALSRTETEQKVPTNSIQFQVVDKNQGKSNA